MIFIKYRQAGMRPALVFLPQAGYCHSKTKKFKACSGRRCVGFEWAHWSSISCILWPWNLTTFPAFCRTRRWLYNMACCCCVVPCGWANMAEARRAIWRSVCKRVEPEWDSPLVRVFRNYKRLSFGAICCSTGSPTQLKLTDLFCLANLHCLKSCFTSFYLKEWSLSELYSLFLASQKSNSKITRTHSFLRMYPATSQRSIKDCSAKQHPKMEPEELSFDARRCFPAGPFLGSIGGISPTWRAIEHRSGLTKDAAVRGGLQSSL